jgi:hypothetical protein
VVIRFIFCWKFRRKPGRTTGHNDHSSLATEISPPFEGDLHSSSKTLLIPTKSSSPSNKKPNRYVEQSINDDTPPAIPPRKPLDKKNSDHNSSTQSTINDDTLLPNPRKLSGKEVR